MNLEQRAVAEAEEKKNEQPVDAPKTPEAPQAPEAPEVPVAPVAEGN